VNAQLDPGASAVATRAREIADLASLSSAMLACSACAELASGRTSVVVGDFPAGAAVMLIGEAPGAQEDESGRPFVGRAGQLLDTLLGDAGLARGSVAVANVLKCRPPGNRTPTRAETGRCRGWLDRQVDLVDPAVVVTLGTTALAWALGPGNRLMDVRGRVHDWRGRRLVATYHPSAALRFGPNGAPRAALREDLGLAAEAACRT
jgi:DNA polymerase